MVSGGHRCLIVNDGHNDNDMGCKKQVTWLPSPRFKAQAQVCMPARGAPVECYYKTLLCCEYFFIVECGIARFLCAVRVFEVLVSSSSLRLPLCQISFLSRPPLLNAELAHGEKSRTQSLSHSSRLFDAPRTEALVLRNNRNGMFYGSINSAQCHRF